MKRWICLCCMICLLGISALAADLPQENTAEEAAALLVEELDIPALKRAVPPEARSYVNDLNLDAPFDSNAVLSGTLEKASGQMGGLLRESMGGMVIIFAIIVLCSMASVMREGLTKGPVDTVLLAGVLAIATVSVAQVGNLMQIGTSVIHDMDIFSKALLPTMAGAAVAAGQTTAATTRHIITMLFSDVLLTLITKVLIPLVYAYVAAVIAGAAIGQDMLGRLASFIKWVITALLTLFLVVFIGYLSISAVIAGSADAVAVKSVKLAVSGAVPVVGSILSDAAETILVGAGLVKSTLGVFGLVVILAICIAPFVRVGLQYLLYKLMAAVSTPLADERLVKLLDGLGGAFGLILGMTGSSVLLIFISIISAISGGQT